MFYDFKGDGELINLTKIRRVSLQLESVHDEFDGVRIKYYDNQVHEIFCDSQEDSEKMYGSFLVFLIEKGLCNDFHEVNDEDE
jgi:hypothetical protein